MTHGTPLPVFLPEIEAARITRGEIRPLGEATDRPLLPAEHNALKQLVTKLAAATGEPSKQIWQSMLELSGVKDGELIPAKLFNHLVTWLQARQTLSQQNTPTLESLQMALKQPLDASELAALSAYIQQKYGLSAQSSLSSAMTIRVTTPSTSSGGGITNAQFTYINHGDAYAPGWRRDYNTKNQQPAFALGQTGSTVGNDKAVGWNWNSGVYNANIGGASTLILHFNMNTGSCPAVQFRVNYRNGGIFYRSARDGYGFEADWSEIYTTTRKPSAGDVGAYTQAECNSRFITGIRLGGLSSVQTWNGPGWSDRSGYVVTGSVNGNRDELIDTTQARPIQYCINGTWYNAGSI